MKKIGVMLFLILFLFVIPMSLQIISAEGVDETGVPELEGEYNKIMDVSEKIPTDQESFEETREEYLHKEWVKIIQSNRFLGPVNNFLENISIVFTVLFGRPYSLSWTLFFVIVVWFWFAFFVSRFIKSGFSALGNYAYPIGFGSSLVLSQINLFERLIVGINKIVSAGASWWVKLIVIGVAVIIGFVIHFFGMYLSEYMKEKREKNEKEATSQSQKEINAYAKGLKEEAE